MNLKQLLKENSAQQSAPSKIKIDKIKVYGKPPEPPGKIRLFLRKFISDI